MVDGKIALVTGGSSGIGRATALAFAREGARVAVADVDVSGGKETVARIGAAGGDAIFVRTDVRLAAEVAAMVNATVAAFGGLDCAFNNAGIAGGNVAMVDCSQERWDRVLSTNLTGVWLCMKHQIPVMIRQGGGAIVNTASVYGLVGSHRKAAAYIASKHGVMGLTKAAALEHATDGIRINAVCPGFILTPLLDPATGGDPEIEARIGARHPMKRLGTAEEVAEAVLWLCSDASRFVTGTGLSVDGGYVAQ